MKTAAVVALTVLGLGAALGAVTVVVRIAAREHADPARCGAGLVAVGARCCAPGQVLAKGRCYGRPASCPPGMHLAESQKGCVASAQRILFLGGRVTIGAEDWQAEGVVSPRRAELSPFALDATEVTYERWEHCVHAGACRSLADHEPGVPVTGVDPKEAERYCRFEGGRLPTGDEWLLAALGSDGRRFPWGPTGLVCRRAAFGLEAGPCARGGGVEISGSRPDGATPERALDLAGNAAEWTVEAGGRAVARGGSYRSRSALELKSWAAETPPARAPHVGFRCAYTAEGDDARVEGVP